MLVTNGSLEPGPMSASNQAAAEFDLTLAYGDPRLYPEQAVTFSGCKPEIGQRWRIAEATHTLEPGKRLTTDLKLELEG